MSHLHRNLYLYNRRTDSHFWVSWFGLPGDELLLTAYVQRVRLIRGHPHRLVAYQRFRIIPQAVSVRYGLAVGARCVPLVLAMMYILGLSVSAPIPQLSLKPSQTSSHRVARRQITRSHPRRKRGPHLQEGGTQVFLTVPSARGGTSAG